MQKNDSFQINPARRTAHLQPYFFVSLDQKIEVLKQNNIDVIRLDMGSPDLAPPDFVINTLIEYVKRSDSHGYSPQGGTKFFREAVANYYLKRFNINLDVESEIFCLIGSKEGLFHLCQVLTEEGDINLVPDPGYPVYSISTKIAGGDVYYLSLKESHNFLPDFSEIPQKILKKTKILWLNYPNNPTGAIAPMEFLKEAVDFAVRNHIVIVYDNPYVDICFGGYKAPSILQIPGAKDVSVEFLSFSKTYNMAGWRLGIAAGNSDIIKYLLAYKSQVDSSHFSPIITAGAAALNSDPTWIKERNKIYYDRQQIVVSTLKESGCYCPAPNATIYVWVKLPQQFSDEVMFSDKLLQDTGVSVTPGSIYGNCGKGYIRISLCTQTTRIDEAMNRLRMWIKHNS